MADKMNISRAEAHSTQGDNNESFFERSAHTLFDAISDMAALVLPKKTTQMLWEHASDKAHLPDFGLNFGKTQAESDDLRSLSIPEFRSVQADHLKNSPFSDALEFTFMGNNLNYNALEDVCLALDSADEIRSRTSADKSDGDDQPTLIVRRDGSIERNSLAPHADQITVEFETSDEQELSIEQKAAVRDLLAYMRMHNPEAKVPLEWNKALDDTLPPPVMQWPQVASVGQASAYSIKAGLRSGDGGGFSGSGGLAHSIMPEGIDRSGKSMDIHTDNTGKLVDSLELHKFVYKVVHAVSGNEGNFTSINPNDAGYGISVGIRQWNQKAGELPNLLQAMHQHNAQKFEHIFGTYAHKLLDESWVRNYHMAGDHDLMNRMSTALHQKDFQHVQVNLARDFVKSSIKLAYQYGLKSELGLALVCDMVNQTGRGGCEAALRRSGLHKGVDPVSEHNAVHKLAHSTDRAGAKQRFEALSKRFSSEKTAVV